MIYQNNIKARSPPPRRADLVAFASDGVYVASANDNYQQFRKVHTSFGSVSGGWDVASHVRLVADLDGTKGDDLLGFGNRSVWTVRNDGQGALAPEERAINEFGALEGSGEWKVENHLRVLADVRNTGRLDVVGFGDNGVWVSLNKGGSFAEPHFAIDAFSYSQNWRREKHARILGDTTGDGTLDIVAFGTSDILIGRNIGGGKFKLENTNIKWMTYDNGWHGADTHPRFLADLTGDGTADIIGFQGMSVYAILNDGKGNFQPVPHLITTGFTSCAEGDPGFVVPLTRTGIMDILRFGEAGVYVARGKGDGTFQIPMAASSDFGRRDGWTAAHTRVLADTTGNGVLDIVGFKGGEVYIALNNGYGAFGPAKRVATNFPGEAGHNEQQTVRAVGNIFPAPVA